MRPRRPRRADDLEAVLGYCAEQRCRKDDASCPGCRLRTERLGIKTLDDFVARHCRVLHLYLARRGP
jgi:hypothetical protein